MKKIIISLIIALAITPSAFAGIIGGDINRLDSGSTASGTGYLPIYQNDTVEKVTPVQISDATGKGFFTICGEATTINNNTVYYGASNTLTANIPGGVACSIDAAGSTTESSVDEAIFTNQAFNVTGMWCRNEGDANANISFTLRSAEAATTPSVTCTIADGERNCVADVSTTTQIAAGATVSVAGASTSNVADNNGFVCTVAVSY